MEIQQIKQLYQAMDEQNYSELELEMNGTNRIKLIIDNSVSLNMQSTQNIQTGTQPIKSDSQYMTILAEKVGSFVSKDNFKLGAKIKKGDIVGIIQGISFQDTVKAPCSGVITELFVNNADVVDFGKLLFTLDIGEA